jgi:hypothetical protein
MGALDDSLFVSDKVHERKVTLPDGQEHTLFFRELPALEFRKFAADERSPDENVRAGSVARLIVASLCEADGKPALTMDKARKLKASAAEAILSVVLKLNGVGQAGEQGNG